MPALPRIAPLAAAAAVLIWAALQLRERGPGGLPWLPPCPFHQSTGLACPGCGMTRATYALLHGKLADALRLNPLGIVLLPVALVGLSLEAVAQARRTPAGPRLRVGARGAWIIAASVLVFWLVRNLPFWPWPLPPS